MPRHTNGVNEGAVGQFKRGNRRGSMKVTKIEYLGKCRDGSDAEAYKYYEGKPPLPPQDIVSPDSAPVTRIVLPAALSGPHRVYLVTEGEDIESNESAAFGMIELYDATQTLTGREPVCWMAQSGIFLQGRKAIKRVFGDLYDWEKLSAFDMSIDAARGILERNERGGKYLLAADTGDGWHVEASNDIEAMDALREAFK